MLVGFLNQRENSSLFSRITLLFEGSSLRNWIFSLFIFEQIYSITIKMFLLLTLNIFHTFFECFYIEFKKINVSWVICLIFDKLSSRRTQMKRFQKGHKFSLHSEVHLEPSQTNITAQKMKFPIKDFLGKCDQIRRFLRIWSHLLKKSLIENFIFCAVYDIAVCGWNSVRLKSVKYFCKKLRIFRDWNNNRWSVTAWDYWKNPVRKILTIENFLKNDSRNEHKMKER